MKQLNYRTFLIPIVVILAISLYWNWKQNAVINWSQKQNGETNTQTIGNFDLQVRCADVAAKLFKQAGYDVVNNPADSYTNHWNKSLEKCFILIQSMRTTNGQLYTEKDLVDALESKVYGTFFKSNNQTSTDCEEFPNGNLSNVRVCKSEGEFDNFVNTYMEN